MSASRIQPPRRQALFALASVAFFVAALLWLDRVGVRSAGGVAPGTAPSGAWVCPHGGAPEVSLAMYLANPGSVAVTARITGLGTDAAASPESYEVPAGSTVRIDQVPHDRGAATYIEYFGGWIGAGWVSSTDGGVAAEPCAADAARDWYLADETTQLGEEAFVVVANPFAAPAVLDVVLYTADRAPIRDSEWTDLVDPGPPEHRAAPQQDGRGRAGPGGRARGLGGTGGRRVPGRERPYQSTERARLDEARARRDLPADARVGTDRAPPPVHVRELDPVRCDRADPRSAPTRRRAHGARARPGHRACVCDPGGTRAGRDPSLHARGRSGRGGPARPRAGRGLSEPPPVRSKVRTPGSCSRRPRAPPPSRARCW